MNQLQKKKKHLWIKLTLSILILFLFIIIAMFAYASQAYEPLPDMYDAIDSLDLNDIEVTHKMGAITYHVDQPTKNIIVIPGGLVEPESYLYLASLLALSGYQVTIVKPLFHLAILSPNQASKYLSDELDNILIGHSLGGVVAGMIAHKHENISTVILLASYVTHDISMKDVLVITASEDLVTDQEQFNLNVDYLGETATIIDMTGANHAQFGWYGSQKGDGVATLSTKEQQDLVVSYMINFIEN